MTIVRHVNPERTENENELQQQLFALEGFGVKLKFRMQALIIETLGEY